MSRLCTLPHSRPHLSHFGSHPCAVQAFARLTAPPPSCTIEALFIMPTLAVLPLTLPCQVWAEHDQFSWKRCGRRLLELFGSTEPPRDLELSSDSTQPPRDWKVIQSMSMQLADSARTLNARMHRFTPRHPPCQKGWLLALHQAIVRLLVTPCSPCVLHISPNKHPLTRSLAPKSTASCQSWHVLASS